ncbi:MAG: PLP-dependent aminotransferase family protein [Chryseobacterium sp.]|jgi:GntR family transcriptional regulator/MocR family aminotransferase|uniref:MocR-like pyridoxine biosynthesis transcription factor PdxR n=1 Tax=Chryseobacterium sp. TaxID=1871047 RepID=UPI002819865F|nr:PLP-dependent aminotransferase family protein [Chryseobacterium sp.]MDR2236916.1 PLP-dependent aminotransferase family protein [Chryseobacterium sp.]
MFPFERIIIINKESSTSVYRQIAVSIIHAVRNGSLKAGMHLPGTRDLARTLGVHRKTVIAAYDELHAQDWITVIPRKHTAISDRIPVFKPQEWSTTDAAPGYGNKFSLPFKVIHEAEKSDYNTSVPGMIIDDGHPDVRISPIDELLKTYRSYTSKKHTIKNAATGTDQGTPQLRQELARHLSSTRGLNISPDHLLITHGAQMGIYLAAQLLLGNESVIVTGQPNYPAANEVFQQTGATLIEIAADENGIDTDQLESLCKKKKINAVYVIPHHHYPTTVTLSVDRRMKLAELSVRYSFAIIEDDYDYDYHYTSSPYLPLASSNHHGNIIYTGSFSKILDPSLRIGFMVAPENFIAQCTAFRKLIDVGGDGYMQNALASLIRNGDLKRHLKKAKKIYHHRRDFLNRLLKEKLDDRISYTLPSGGMAIWIILAPEFHVRKLAENTGLKIIRTDEKRNAFRFGFASMNEKELEAAVEFLKNLLIKE